MAATGATAGTGRKTGMSGEEKRVIFASSLGTVFEWYDFYLYATLAPFFAALFFPPGNDTAALLSAFATYAAGFLVRPFGAIIFGRLGDLAGRKYTFIVTILVMGTATFAVGLLPTFETIGWLAPVLLVSLRLLQGLALGGEYGGAATYVAEHARPHSRGFATSWIQTTATLGFFMALVIIGACRFFLFEPEDFAEWGWRLPFLVSLVLLIFSVYIRLMLNESPVFLQMREEGRGSKSPIRDSFFRYPNNKFVLLALLAAAGLAWRRRSAAAVPQIERPTVGTAGPSGPVPMSAALTVQVENEKLIRSAAFATLKYHMTLVNRTDAPLTDVAVGLDLVSAHAGAPMEEQVATLSVSYTI